MSRQLAFLWGYGHYVVFASLGALGAGLQLAAAGSHGALSSTTATTAGLAVAVPVAAYLRRDRCAAGPPGVAVARPRHGWCALRRCSCSCSGCLASGLGIGLSTLLMGVVVAALVASTRSADPGRLGA